MQYASTPFCDSLQWPDKMTSIMFIVVVFYVTFYRSQMADGGRTSYPQHQQLPVHHPNFQQHQQKSGAVKVRDCEPIKVGLCSGLGYEVTGMPNLVGHETQQEAEQQLGTFKPLIQYGCSSRLTVFLCSAYVPMCSEKVQAPIGPCASLCEAVRQRCEPVLNEFGFPWPLALNCSKFPPSNEYDSMCMEGPNEYDHDRTKPRTLAIPAPSPSVRGTAGPSSGVNCDGFRHPTNYVLLNRTQRCALLCSKDDVFSSEQKSFADAWMSVWSGLCFVTTLITILTFVIDSGRFGYPERTFVFMAFCHGVCSVSYLVRLIAGRDTITCHTTTDSSTAVRVLVQEGIEKTDCTVVFLLLYYFSTAGSVWWVILTVLWFLNASFDRSYESLARHGTLLHVAAWSVPAATTIAVLVLRSVDADELTAMCHVGYRSQTGRLWFVLLPTGVFLFLGLVFLVAGFVCTVRTRKQSGLSGGARPGKAEAACRASRIRIGAFLLVHAVLTTCILSVQCYEYTNRHRWSLVGENLIPNVTVLMFGVAANLTIGIVSAIWFWRGESLQSWQRFCSKVFRCCCGSLAKDGRVVGGVGGGGGGGVAQKPAVIALSPDTRVRETPTKSSRPIYRVTAAAERNVRDPHFPRGTGHKCHHHCHQQQQQRSPFINHTQLTCDRVAMHSPLQCRLLNGDITVL